MNYLLDTNVCIHFLNGTCDNVLKNMSLKHPKNIFLCSVVKGELLAGAFKSKYVEKTIEKLKIFFSEFSSYSFDDNSAKIYGQIRANLEKKGKIIGGYDLQIASIALNNDLTLVTHNTKEFSRVDKLKIEDWEI